MVARCEAWAHTVAVAALVSGLMPGPGWAQPVLSLVPDTAQEQRRAQERQQQRQQDIEREQTRRSQEGSSAQAQASQTDPHARLPQGEDPCFPISQIQYTGVNPDNIPAELLQGLDSAIAQARDAQSRDWEPDSPIGRCLGANAINILLERAQNHLISRGYITSRVLAAPQDLQTGTLTLTLIPGVVAGIRLAPDTPAEVARRVGLLTALPMKSGDLLNLRDIEQALDNFKRAPSADADIQIAPAPAQGSTPLAPHRLGASDLVIHYQQKLPLRLNLSADDSGSNNTGKYQGAITLSLDNLLTLNDLLYITLNHDLGGAQRAGPPPRGTAGHSLYLSVPFGYWSAGGTWTASRYNQSVAGASQSYLYSGDSKTFELFASRVLYRDASRKTTATVKAWSRASHNWIDDTEVEVQRRRVGGWAAQIGHRQHLGASSLELNLTYKRGTGAFGSLPAAEQAFGEGTSRFGLITADASLSAPFALGSQRLRYSGSWRWQVNRTALTPQDRFAIGGRYSVRGFDGESSLMGERGWLMRNELSAILGQSRQELYLGIDYGQVAGPSSQSLLGRSLAGMVLGLRGSGSGLAQGLSYELFIGTPIHKPQGFKTADLTSGFSLNWQF